VIGGVSLRGGQGTVIGVLLGAVIMMIINSTLSLMGIDHFWQQVLKGGVILVAVMANIMIQRAAIKRTLARREL
jgi:ribose/xylose/arabinose/galactoside ABC-type transport system permease subunit